MIIDHLHINYVCSLPRMAAVYSAFQMSLYQVDRKPRPFKHKKGKFSNESDSDGAEEAWSSGEKHKRQRKQQDNVVVSTNSNRTRNSAANTALGVDNNTKVRSSSYQEVVELTDTPEKAAADTKVVAVAQKGIIREPVDLVDEEMIDVNDPLYESAKTLLNKLNASRRKLDVAGVQAQTGLTPIARRYLVPEVKSAAQRMQQAKQLGRSSTLQRTRIQQSSSAPSASTAPQITIRTRLNGQHEHHWAIGEKERLSVLLQRLAGLYGVAAEQLRLSFDGDKLSPEQTPQALDMEAGEEYLVEANVEAKIFERAVAHAESRSKK
jgi:hypothetical protein